MKIVCRILFFCIVTVSQIVLAQAKYTLNQSLDFWISNCEKNVTGVADAMPENKYSFAPSSTLGKFAGVRTFGEQVKHLAANNYRMAAYIQAQTPTHDQEVETGPDNLRSKAQIMDYLRGSFVALHQAVATLTAQSMLEPSASHPTGSQNNALQFAIDAVAHSYDHYGQMVEYLRMNGVAPPKQPE